MPVVNSTGSNGAVCEELPWTQILVSNHHSLAGTDGASGVRT